MEPFQNLIDALPDGVVITDAQGTIREVNFQVAIMLGYSRAELVGQSVELLIPEQFRERYRMFRGEYLKSPRIRPMGSGLVLYARRRDGSLVAVDISLCPHPQGPEMLVISIIRDVSQRRQA